jgi:formate/nitrite transporter
MAFMSPPEITRASVELGVHKSQMSAGKMLVGGFLAGAYIAFAGMLAITASAGLDPAKVGGVITLITGSVFTLGLILVVIAGSELLTGNMAMVPIAAFARRVTPGRMSLNFAVVLIGNLLGSLFVAYFLAVQSGVIGGPSATPGTSAALMHNRLLAIAESKGVTETAWQIFLRAVGCNWLVCLAVWMSLGAKAISGKILAIFFPIMAFVALGFDHVVANMFFLPAAIWAGDPNLGWDDTLRNWLFAFLGNLVGAGVFVATSYWYLYLRDEEPADASAPSTTETSR